jgi:hypothetical protein
MKRLLLLLMAGSLVTLVAACDAGYGNSYNETYEQVNYRDNSFGPSEGEKPLFPLSPSGGNTY